METGESCDDGNQLEGDGCNGQYFIESGHACNTEAPGLIGNAGCEAGLCDFTDGNPGLCIVPWLWQWILRQWRNL